jgi:metallo-beta-lactamase family protein
MQLTFLGAAGTVTGSKTLVQYQDNTLLVDCGLFQGYKNLRLMNWQKFAFNPRDLDAVVLTHAHLDHSGALPLLIKRGFEGPVYATPSSIEVCRILLLDSGRLQEEDAAFMNRHHASKHQPALPLYTEADAERALKYLCPLPFDKHQTLADFNLRLRPAGHILGAGYLELGVANHTLLFSGDLGRPDDAIMHPPTPIERADYLVVESTYGDRLHDAHESPQLLVDIIDRTVTRGGIVLMPAFAVGRAQELLYAIYRLKQSGAIAADLPVFLNSPMAIDMTQIYQRYRAEHRLSAQDCQGMCQVAKMVRTVEESRELNRLRYPAIIISASGMATGGRVLHHLKTLAPDRRNSIVFAGFQAGGTRGARMLAGESSIRIHGEEIAIKAEVLSLPGMSAHADAQQIIQWLKTLRQPPKEIFLNHGEPAAADALRQRIEREFNWQVSVPLLNQKIVLE